MSTNSYKKDFLISWEELHRNTKELAWKLNEKNTKWKGIIAIARGGMVPACIIARELEVLNIETFCITSYDVKEQSQTKILKKPETVKNNGQGWLIIDDLVDTGRTFELSRELYPEAHYACIYVKPQGAKQTDTYITEFSQDTWVHFPWDMENQYSVPLARRDN